MGDQPTAEALLEAMADTLDRQVVPSAVGGAQHAARVVANLCRIIGRELASEPGSGAAGDLEAEVWRLLGSDEPPDDVPPMGQASALSTEAVAALDRALRSPDPQLLDAALPLLRRDVERRLAISKPTYLEDRP
ncbi:MAG: DUF6285 domain-containing protein [Microthrixaceae bacterium]